MPTNQTPLQRPRRLSLGHEAEMSLRYGDLAERPAFACDDGASARPPGSTTATGC